MEFRKMRRSRQELTYEQCEEVLNRNTAGILAVLGDGGYPYAVPLSYAYHEGAVYFHCATAGHKLDALQNSAKVSFCVVDKDEIVPEKYTTYFRSVIIFGQATCLSDPSDMHTILSALGRKYAPNETQESLEKEINGSISRTVVVKLNIDHMTGKEAKELANRRNP